MILDKPMSFDECLSACAKVARLRRQGKKVEAEALMKTVAILPEQAAAIKKYCGLDMLRAMDVNLSNALVKYGPDFFER
jgi:hypothetical protein